MFFYFIKQRKLNSIVLGFSILFVITFFKLMFFNRFLAHLDVFIILLAGLGLERAFKNFNKKWLLVPVILLLALSILNVAAFAAQSRPLISQSEFDFIGQIEQKTEEKTEAPPAEEKTEAKAEETPAEQKEEDKT